ncbi:caspase recruitment domain-containing protein 9 isoform X1 [Echinops telfairi]|uniref:Caspase recruitment domain-containing protein 9 isoform X1 n=1 Tax=Echinops telfairi TaxID=9371 RepID=A0AC55D0E3_ECHTE|nr:caspase recruitment domain-containing protein 9 isoform X1 [Echinops telfairi]
MSDYENEDECWTALESFRVKLISVIDPARITPYLRQCKVLHPDDEEQVLSDPSLVIRKRKVGVLLDILQRTGHKGYVAFLESLELYYPQLYRKVTGKEPARVFSMIIDASGESGLTQLLMSEVQKLQKKVQDLTALLSAKDDFIKELRLKDSLLRKHQERVRRLKEEAEGGARELKRCKDENYELALRLARLSEEKGAALMRNRDLQLEVDRLQHSLMKAEDDCKVERKRTLKLRHAMEQWPSQELLWELQQEKALLQARVQELEAAAQDGKQDKSSTYIQVLEEDWRQALRAHQDQASTIFSLRKDLRQAEAQRVRSVEEKEMFELQCRSLRKDSKMYKERMEAVLQQMEEVAIERDQAIATREALHTQHAQGLQEKDGLRKRVRELSEKADELQLQLFQREGQLLAAEGRLKQQQLDVLVLSSDLEDSSPRSSQELSLPQALEEEVQLSDTGSTGPRPPGAGGADSRTLHAGSQAETQSLEKEPHSLTPNLGGRGLSLTPSRTQA